MSNPANPPPADPTASVANTAIKLPALVYPVTWESRQAADPNVSLTPIASRARLA